MTAQTAAHAIERERDSEAKRIIQEGQHKYIANIDRNTCDSECKHSLQINVCFTITQANRRLYNRAIYNINKR